MDLTTVEPGLALLHDEAGHAAVPRRGGGIGQREERERIALAAIGDEHLRAGDEVAVAVPPRHRAQGLDVGARVRLGEAEAAARLAAGEARQEPRALLVRPVVEHDQRGHGVAIEDAGERHEPAADLLDHPRVGRDVEAEPAVCARHEGAEEAELSHPRDQRVRIGVGVLERGRRRLDLGLHERAHRRDDRVRDGGGPSDHERPRGWTRRRNGPEPNKLRGHCKRERPPGVKRVS